MAIFLPSSCRKFCWGIINSMLAVVIAQVLSVARSSNTDVNVSYGSLRVGQYYNFGCGVDQDAWHNHELSEAAEPRGRVTQVFSEGSIKHLPNLGSWNPNSAFHNPCRPPPIQSTSNCSDFSILFPWRKKPNDNNERMFLFPFSGYISSPGAPFFKKIPDWRGQPVPQFARQNSLDRNTTMQYIELCWRLTSFHGTMKLLIPEEYPAAVICVRSVNMRGRENFLLLNQSPADNLMGNQSITRGCKTASNLPDSGYLSCCGIAGVNAVDAAGDLVDAHRPDIRSLSWDKTIGEPSKGGGRKGLPFDQCEATDAIGLRWGQTGALFVSDRKRWWRIHFLGTNSMYWRIVLFYPSHGLPYFQISLR